MTLSASASNPGTCTYNLVYNVTVQAAGGALCDEALVGTNKLVGCSYNINGLSTSDNNFQTSRLLGTAPTGPTAGGTADNFTALNDPGWGYSSGPGGQADWSSARWKGTFNFTGGTYRFTIGGQAGLDDHAKLLVDGTQIYAAWPNPACCGSKTYDAVVSGGTRTIQLDYREDGGGAYVSLAWAIQAVNQPPIANATISKDGTTYADSITVTQGVATPVYLAAGSSAGTSSDPDGWTHGSYGMSNGGGRCEWNRDLNQGPATFEQPDILNPNTPANCNTSLGSLTFNDAPGIYTYQVLRLTDRAGGVSGVDTVQVTVAAPAVPPPSPPDGGCGGSCLPPVDNGTGGGSAACNTVKLTWTDTSSNETGFYVYKNSTGNPPVAGDRIATLPANTTTYTYSVPDTNPYYYFVSAYNAGGESAKIAASNNAVASIACQANLTGSDKDITAVSGLTFTPGACNGAYESTPPAVKFFENALVSFRINICNTGGADDATSVIVTDYLTNLIQPTAGWQAQLCNGNACANMTAGAGVGQYQVSGTSPNQIIVFNVGTVPYTGSASRNIRFNAQIASSAAPTSRFNNRAVIDYIKDAAGTPGNRPVSIPWLPYYTAKGAPTKIEIPPR